MSFSSISKYATAGLLVGASLNSANAAPVASSAKFQGPKTTTELSKHSAQYMIRQEKQHSAQYMIRQEKDASTKPLTSCYNQDKPVALKFIAKATAVGTLVVAAVGLAASIPCFCLSAVAGRLIVNFNGN